MPKETFPVIQDRFPHIQDGTSSAEHLTVFPVCDIPSADGLAQICINGAAVFENGGRLYWKKKPISQACSSCPRVSGLAPQKQNVTVDILIDTIITISYTRKGPMLP